MAYKKESSALLFWYFLLLGPVHADPKNKFLMVESVRCNKKTQKQKQFKLCYLIFSLRNSFGDK